MKVLVQLFGIIVIALGSSACKCSAPAEKGDAAMAAMAKVQDNAITEKYWKLIELNGDAIDVQNQNREPHIILKAEDKRLNGTGGCNTFNGSYELENATLKIKFSQVISTMMACMDMEVESKMLKMFDAIDNYTISADGKYLSLNKGRMAPLARFEVVEK